VASGRELRTLAGHTGHVYGVALSGDGRVVVSASSDNTLKVREVASGRELRTLAGHTGSVEGVALSGDGRIAVSASWDKTLKVWDVESSAVVATFTCDGAAQCCALDDSHKLVVAGDAGGRVHFLRLEEPKPKN
jgi:WD40 repeat protein